MASRRQTSSRAKAVNSVERVKETVTPSKAPSKIDKTGLYDLHQVKRVLDDQVISVSIFASSLPLTSDADVTGRSFYIRLRFH